MSGPLPASFPALFAQRALLGQACEQKGTAHMRRHMIMLLCLLLTLLHIPSAQAAGTETLVLSTADPAPLSNPDGTGANDRVVAEAFRRLGIPARLVRLSAERALHNADQGVDDGTYARIAGLSDKYPNLVKVPEPVSEFLFTAFTRNPKLVVKGWEGLKPHHVGLVIGWKIVEANTGGVRERTSVKDEQTLFAMLGSGRLEVAVLERYAGRAVARSLGLADVRALEPPLERRDMFLYLHKRHADLVPRLAETLRQMKRDGTFQHLARAGLAESGQAEAGR